ncbi:DMT family transporter [uncultured Turicimonas sp.]|uniref:DMT family transporter n=1 Tax=uncultured Turicimonas sp. TaxID=1918607 RepID=UPI002803A229|nr:DMT family transporter [uncultured Turicimonas sp.]
MQSLWMLVAGVFYALYGVFIKLAGECSINSWQILFYRSVFGVVVFYILMRAKGIRVTTTHPVEHIIRSLAGTASILAGIYSMMHLNLGLAMTLNFTAPLFLGAGVVGFSLFRHQSINWGLIASLVTGFLGVVIMLGPTIGPHEYFAACVGLFAGLCTATASGFVKRLGVLMEPETRIIFYLVSMGAVAGTVGVVMTGGFSAWTWTSAIYILALCLCANLGQLCLTMAFSRGNLVLSSSLQYSVILFSTIFGEILFAEPVTLPVVVGMIIIVASGIFASYLVRKISPKKKAAASSTTNGAASVQTIVKASTENSGNRA